MRIALLTIIVAIGLVHNAARGNGPRGMPDSGQVIRGRYLATIGACSACHTPPRVAGSTPAPGSSDEAAERKFRTDPDWTRYLDQEKLLAGGVPFWMRFSGSSHGQVFSRNLTPDVETGLGTWTDQEVVRALREGIRKDGKALFLFPPHSFFKNLALRDAEAIVAYLRTLKPVRNEVPSGSLPFPTAPQTATTMVRAPIGRTKERAEYLMNGLIGCRECHSHSKNGKHHEFVGGDPSDPFTGVFRFGPDLPLRASERGLANFPYPGYAVTYAGNLTKYGKGGPLESTRLRSLVNAIRMGVSPRLDDYGRPIPLNHVMLWQFYGGMKDEDVEAIARYLKRLPYVPHEVPPLEYFGTDWAAAFTRVFGEQPTAEDRRFFGK